MKFSYQNSFISSVYLVECLLTMMEDISSFNGEISEIPGIAVDNFMRKNAWSRAYFISHFHMDHVQGLAKPPMIEHLEKTNAQIYTTEITKAIISAEFGNHPVVKYVKALNKDYNLITLPSVPEENLEELLVDVTLIPAGHSLGSTMFLFKIPGKTILYTGDFRIRINDIAKYTKLHDRHGDPIHIDALYVDTTFIEEKYEEFAKRSDTVDTLVDEIEKWTKMSQYHGVAISLPANYTFEFIFKRIYERLNMKVYVNNTKWRLYRTIQELVPGITNNCRSLIHLCSWKTLTSANTYCDHYVNVNYLHIRLTAYKWSKYNTDYTPIEWASKNQLFACFSTHCSRSELTAFVEHFSPKKIVGFPNEYVATPKKTQLEDYAPSPKGKSGSAKKKEERKRRLESASGLVNRKILK